MTARLCSLNASLLFLPVDSVLDLVQQTSAFGPTLMNIKRALLSVHYLSVFVTRKVRLCPRTVALCMHVHSALSLSISLSVLFGEYAYMEPVS